MKKHDGSREAVDTPKSKMWVFASWTEGFSDQPAVPLSHKVLRQRRW